MQRLITSYPKFETVRYGIAQENIKSLVAHEVLNRIGINFPQVLRSIYNPQYQVFELFDRHAARHIPRDTEIFVGLSSGALHSMRRAKRLGIKTVLERGSSHMLQQSRVLAEEYERLGIKAVIVHPKVVDKELAEYQEADYICIPSSYVKRTFLDQGFAEQKLLHNPYGVNLVNFYPIPKEDKVFRVIHCGNLSIRKGVHYLLQAFAELRLPNAELWLIGNITEEIVFFSEHLSLMQHVSRTPFQHGFRSQALGPPQGMERTAAQAHEDIGIPGYMPGSMAVKELKDMVLGIINSSDIMREIHANSVKDLMNHQRFDILFVNSISYRFVGRIACYQPPQASISL